MAVHGRKTVPQLPFEPTRDRTYDLVDRHVSNGSSQRGSNPVLPTELVAADDDGTFFQRNTKFFNCYAYAVGDRSNPTDVVGSIPGAAAGAPMSTLSIGEIRRGLEKDGATPVDVDQGRLPPNRAGYRLIAAVLSPRGKPNFHFYRQEMDGRWTHKAARSPVSDKDADGRDITDPRTANRDYRNVLINGLKWDLNYQVFAGLFYVPLEGFVTGKAPPPKPGDTVSRDGEDFSMLGIAGCGVGTLGTPFPAHPYRDIGEALSQTLLAPKGHPPLRHPPGGEQS